MSEEDVDEFHLEDVVGDVDPIDDVDDTLEQLADASTSAKPADDYPIEAVGDSACRFCQAEFDTLSAERTHLCDGRRGFDHLDDLDGGIIAPQMHEVGAQWLFDANGMDPYFAIVSAFDNVLDMGDGDRVGTFEAAGTTWELNHEENKIKFWKGKIATRAGDSGDQYYEYNIGVVAKDDVGRRRVNFQFRPALPNATHVDSGEPIGSLPDDLPEGIRVQVDGANVALDDYIDVLRELARAMDVNPEYFCEDELHEWSRCYNQAPYVRVRRVLSEQRIVPRDGLLDRLSTHAAQQRGAGRYEWDNREIMGHRNTVAMDAQNIEPFAPGQTVGKLLKSYHMKNPEEQAGTVTSHPKLEVQYSTEFSFGDFKSVPWRDGRDFDAYDLRDELVEWLLNCLDWAGITLTPDEDVYVADEYFNVDSLDDEVSVQLVPNPMPDLEETKRTIAEHHVLGRDLTKGDIDVLEALTEGGAMHHEDLAEASGRSTAMVYRTAEKLKDIIRNRRGIFQVADQVIQDRLADLFSNLERAANWVGKSIDKIIQEDSDYDLAENSPLAKWMRRYGVSIDTNGRGRETWHVDVQIGRYDLAEIRRILRSGYHAARATGSTVSDCFLDAAISWTDEDGEPEFRERAFTITAPQVRALGMPVSDFG